MHSLNRWNYRSNLMWTLIVPAIAGPAVAGCFMIVGHYVDKAAVAVETPAAFWGRTHEPRVSFPIDKHCVLSQVRETPGLNVGEDDFTTAPNGRPSPADFYESVLHAHD